MRGHEEGLPPGPPAGYAVAVCRDRFVVTFLVHVGLRAAPGAALRPHGSCAGLQPRERSPRSVVPSMVRSAGARLIR